MSDWIVAEANPVDARTLPRVRLFAILGTWMEADIVAATIRNAVTQGCERVYLVDNGSPDETVAIAVAEGALLARSFTTAQYDEHLRLRHMNDVVAEVSASEPDDHIWWLFLDADEFAHGPWGMTLLDYLRTLDERFRVVGTRYFNHYPSQRPAYSPGRHPLDFQPLCEELVYPMCPSGHRKHPLQRYDKGGARIECGRGFHLAQCTELLYEPSQPAFLHHFPFRDEAVTRARLGLLWAKDAAGASRALESDDATGHMLPRFRSLDAVYAQDWGRVENFIASPPVPGVRLAPWTEMVDEPHQHVLRWRSMTGAWNYDTLPTFRYGDDTTYRKGIAFLDGHGTIEDWGCGFTHAKTFVTSSAYRGVDGSSPHADQIVDLTSYRSETDCIFMRHVLEHNVDWRPILANAVASFTRRMVLVIFTPFSETTRVIATASHVTAVPTPDISFKKEDLTEFFKELTYREESLDTDTQYHIEHLFYIEKQPPGVRNSPPVGPDAPALPGSFPTGHVQRPPLVSVVMIFLNALPFLEEAIASVRAQTYPHWELLLVDDGSTDGSTALAERHAASDPGRVRYLAHPGHENRGMSASRNLGLSQARGEYVAFLDGDDVWLAHKLQQQTAILGAHPEVDMVYGNTQFWYSWTGTPQDLGRDCLRGTGFPPDTVVSPPGLIARCYPLGDAPSPATCSIMVRRAAIESVGGFEPAFRGMFEDHAFLAKMYRTATVYISGESWDRYRLHPDSCVSIARATGQDRHLTLFFLNWLEAYLSKQGVADDGVRQALQRALWPYRHPRLHRLSQRLGRLAERLGQTTWALNNRLTRLISRQSTGTVTASPNPIHVADRFALGATTLSWETTGTSAVEIHVNAADGPLLCRGDPVGSTSTGMWVSDGMMFYLQDASAALPHGRAATLAVTVVRVVTVVPPRAATVGSHSA